MPLPRTAFGPEVALEIVGPMLETAPASQKKETRRAMRESTRRTIRSAWFFVAILGYSDLSRVAAATTDDLPPAIASEIKNIDAMCRAIEAGGPIERWRFDSVRARYQAFLKSGSGEPAIKEAIRVREERLAKLEQAAKSAATIQKILAQSHRRDREVIALKRQLDRSPTDRGRSRAYEAVGLLQPSSQRLDGRKLFVLIGKTGGTVAFLDIPPGLDANPSLARRVGVRGVAHYNEDLQSRLITVRNLEPIAATR